VISINEKHASLCLLVIDGSLSTMSLFIQPHYILLVAITLAHGYDSM